MWHIEKYNIFYTIKNYIILMNIKNQQWKKVYFILKQNPYEYEHFI